MSWNDIAAQAERNLESLRADDGTYPAYADGGYPVRYYAEDGETFCHECASQVDAEPPIRYAEIAWEGADEMCDGCGAILGTAYGDPDADTCDATDADECRMMRERLAAGVSNVIPACPSGEHA